LFLEFSCYSLNFWIHQPPQKQQREKTD